MRSISKKSLLDSTFALLLVVLLFYNWYRYPFQVSDSGTSVGYQDTPLALKLGKYLLVATLLLGFLPSVARDAGRQGAAAKASSRVWMLAATGMAYLMAVPLLMGVFYREPMYFDAAASWGFGLAMLLFGPKPGKALRLFPRMLRAFGMVSIVFFFVEVLLFLAFGRLPALSYSDSIAVRFGGLWDDPNGFALVWPLIFPLFLSLRWKYPLILLGVVIWIATQSMTGVASVAVGGIGAATLVVIVRGKVPRAAVSRLLVSVLAASAVAAVLVTQIDWRPVFGVVSDFAEMKSGSVEGHLHSIEILNAVNVPAALGFSPVNEVGESGYVNWLANFGVLYLVAALLVVGASVVRLTKAFSRRADGPGGLVLFAALWFLCSCGIGMFNLSLDRIFPINFLATMICGLILKSERFTVTSGNHKNT